MSQYSVSFFINSFISSPPCRVVCSLHRHHSSLNRFCQSFFVYSMNFFIDLSVLLCYATNEREVNNH
nr:MAG TPA: hypothetical protein [Caudoviricetes sp.]